MRLRNDRRAVTESQNRKIGSFGAAQHPIGGRQRRHDLAALPGWLALTTREASRPVRWQQSRACTLSLGLVMRGK
jgi:hypothetical protein